MDMCAIPSQKFSKWFKKKKLQQLILASKKVVLKISKANWLCGIWYEIIFKKLTVKSLVQFFFFIFHWSPETQNCKQNNLQNKKSNKKKLALTRFIFLVKRFDWVIHDNLFAFTCQHSAQELKNVLKNSKLFKYF